MATAHKHTKTETRTVTEEVTTYTLELTAEEAEWLAAHLGVSAQHSGYAADIEQELRRQAATPNPQPLAVGDRVRVLVDDLDSADVKAGDMFSVTNLLPGGRFAVPDDYGYGGSWYFHLAAEGTGWERI